MKKQYTSFVGTAAPVTECGNTTVRTISGHLDHEIG